MGLGGLKRYSGNERGQVTRRRGQGRRQMVGGSRGREKNKEREGEDRKFFLFIWGECEGE